jgi:hypothetical protein
MPYNVIVSATKDVVATAATGKEAATIAANLKAEGGGPYRVVYVKAEKPHWHDRQRQRFEEGTYKKLPESITSKKWFKAVDLSHHFAHPSLRAPLRRVAFTPDDAAGEADRQVTQSVEAYFAGYYNQVGKDIQEIVRLWSQEYAEPNPSVEFAFNGEDIADLYERSDSVGPGGDGDAGSCMAYGPDNWGLTLHPTAAYGTVNNSDDPDYPTALALAYIKEDGSVVARAIVWPAMKRYNTVYADTVERHDELIAELWRQGYTRDTFEGAHLAKIAAPYEDEDDANEEDDDTDATTTEALLHVVRHAWQKQHRFDKKWLCPFIDRFMSEAYKVKQHPEKDCWVLTQGTDYIFATDTTDGAEYIDPPVPIPGTNITAAASQWEPGYISKHTFGMLPPRHNEESYALHTGLIDYHPTKCPSQTCITVDPQFAKQLTNYREFLSTELGGIYPHSYVSEEALQKWPKCFREDPLFNKFLRPTSGGQPWLSYCPSEFQYSGKNVIQLTREQQKTLSRYHDGVVIINKFDEVYLWDTYNSFPGIIETRMIKNTYARIRNMFIHKDAFPDLQKAYSYLAATNELPVGITPYFNGSTTIYASLELRRQFPKMYITLEEMFNYPLVSQLDGHNSLKIEWHKEQEA